VRIDVSLAQAIAIATQLGLTVVIAVGIGIGGGWFMDSRLGTGPLFLLLGSLVGLAAGVMAAIQYTRMLSLRQARQRQQQREDS